MDDIQMFPATFSMHQQHRQRTSRQQQAPASNKKNSTRRRTKLKKFNDKGDQKRSVGVVAQAGHSLPQQQEQQPMRVDLCWLEASIYTTGGAAVLPDLSKA